MHKSSDSLPRRSGIYKIECLSTQQCYVGKAKNMYARQRRHITCLNKNKHGNKRLVEAFETHKRNGLVFSVLEECPIEQLNLKELEWAYRLKPQLNMQWVEADSQKYETKRYYFSETLNLWLSWSTGSRITLSSQDLSECDRVGSFYIPRSEMPEKIPTHLALQAIEFWLKG